jgi:hypothetical protein
VDFFDDDAATQIAPAPRHSRNKHSQRRMRVERLGILLLVLFIVVFLLAWGVRSCQENRKVNGYKTYLAQVNQAINDSNAIGKEVARFFANPAKLGAKTLVPKLKEWSDRQNEIGTRARSFTPPGKIATQNTVFVWGMTVRARGFELLAADLVRGGAIKPASAAKIAALDSYFAGPDAYYQALFYNQVQLAMKGDSVKGITVPKSTFYQTTQIFALASVESMLTRLSGSPKLGGVHGVALVGVVVKPQGATQVSLVKGSKDNLVTAATQMVFTVRVNNSGTVPETNVRVKLTFTTPGETPIEQTATIATIANGQTVSLDLPAIIPPGAAVSAVSTLSVTVGPVPHEKSTANNKAEFRIILQLAK